MISVDYRETDLIKELKQLSCSNEKWKTIDITETNLDIGDILIRMKEDDIPIIIERKTVRDMAASIEDGRYKEQGFRLNSSSTHNHNIIYLIEGDIMKYKPYHKCRIDKYAIMSALTSVQYSKGFSLYRTLGVEESAVWLLQMTSKIHKSKLVSFYDNVETTDTYVDTLPKTRKKDVKLDNILHVILCQIPGVSCTISKVICERYKSIPDLIDALREDENVLSDLKTKLASGKERKVSKKTLTTIYDCLIRCESK